MAAAEGRGKAPALTQSDANKNSTRGIRERKKILEFTVECIQQDPALARDAYRRAASTGKDSINWKGLCAILADPLLTRAKETRMKVNVGIAADGRRRLLTEDYAKTHAVEIRELDDGTTEEFCAVTVGPNGATEELEVVIGKAASGPLYAEARQAAILARNTTRSRNKFLKACEEAARLPQYMMVDPSAKSNG